MPRNAETPFHSTVKQTGRLFILSAPSGAVKTTLCRALLKHFKGMAYSVSTTTRSPRPGETHGKDYFFVSREEFLRSIQKDEWAEWALVHDHYYGTDAKYLNDQLAAGKDVLLDIDVQGAKKISKRYPESITIFIMPPSFDALRERMQLRGTDSPDVIEKRLSNAGAEMAQSGLYQYIIVNDCLNKALDELISVVRSAGTGPVV
jgi:guanylate kinase